MRPGRQLDLLRALRARADLRRGSGQWRLARADLERIVELDPEDAPSARELAFSLCLEPEESVDDPRRALGLAERSARSGPRDLPLVKALAAACYRLGRLEESEGALREALDLAAKRPAPEVKLLLSMLYQKSGRPSEARQCYDEAKRWIEGGRLDRGLRAESEVLRAEAERILEGR